MKKMKNMKLKAVLLSLVAVLAIGLTSCSDEMSGDQTQGKPGYLSINLKTLQPKQSKVGGDANLDYKTIKDLNIFVFDGTTNALVLDRFYVTSGTNGVEDGDTSVNIQVNSLNAGSYVVVVANYGVRITTSNNITDTNSLVAIPITTVRDVAANGLHMTGMSNIQTTNNGYTYTANVAIAPVEAKITVNWELGGDVASYYDVTGIYVVNAINQTKLPIIRNSQYTTSWAPAINNVPKDYINLIGSTPTKTASYGLVTPAAADYNFYTGMTDATALLSDVKSTQMTGSVLNAGYTPFGTQITSKFHYYVGENYSNNTTPNAGSGAAVDNATKNANTIVVVRVTPLSTAPAYIRNMGHKYYTYEFNRNSTGVGTAPNDGLLGSGTIAADGFSVRRKTNYSLKFNLNELGTTNPFERLRTLQVNVTAEDWDPGSASF